MRARVAALVAVLLIVPAFVAGLAASAQEDAAPVCWDLYDGTGTRVGWVVEPYGAPPLSCTRAAGCRDFFDLEARRGVLVPIGLHPSTCLTPPTSTTTTITTTVAPTTLPPSTTSSTTTVAPTTTTAPTTTLPAGDDFLASFATPADFYDRFNRDVHFRASDYDPNATFHGDHNEMCAGPTTGRVVHLDDDDNDEVFWHCAPNGPDTGHVMTGMGEANFGYSIVTFMPRQTFTGVDRVCVDVGSRRLGGDNWWEMSVVPRSTFDNNGGRMDYVTALARDIDQGALDFPSAAFVFQINDDKIRLYQGMSERVFDWFQWSTSDPAPRFRHCMVDNHDGTVTATRAVGVSNQDAPGGVRTVTVSGSFPAGEVVVLFQHSVYDPPKHGSGELQTTYHWDNVTIEG